jgi:hypothetical protein
MLTNGLWAGSVAQREATMAAEEFREQAEALRKEAARAENARVREQLLLLAAEWEQLAEIARKAQPKPPPE